MNLKTASEPFPRVAGAARPARCTLDRNCYPARIVIGMQHQLARFSAQSAFDHPYAMLQRTPKSNLLINAVARRRENSTSGFHLSNVFFFFSQCLAPVTTVVQTAGQAIGSKQGSIVNRRVREGKSFFEIFLGGVEWGNRLVTEGQGREKGFGTRDLKNKPTAQQACRGYFDRPQACGSGLGRGLAESVNPCGVDPFCCGLGSAG